MTVSDPTLDMHAFPGTRWEGEPVNAAPEEHDDLRWFRPSDLADLKMATRPACRASCVPSRSEPISRFEPSAHRLIADGSSRLLAIGRQGRPAGVAS